MVAEAGLSSLGRLQNTAAHLAFIARWLDEAISTAEPSDVDSLYVSDRLASRQEATDRKGMIWRRTGKFKSKEGTFMGIAMLFNPQICFIKAYKLSRRCCADMEPGKALTGQLYLRFSFKNGSVGA